ncbi:hypothetical protein ATZ33_11015 [Enterococcus silesiacus]|uniref:DUF4375 domain-containing protein n=1 Tax=Enterococcus silesiacus TaxID=332949 RepID=A0A0S3KCE1_9ENTE|nr:hypothetical protein [Enterococcus silesiacus]ALS01890.1 hypothetical protein ATZ33_11015 [Enterococcus silesiacus]OJG92152.1 hypothetical protein RV15_GL003537 [Enterococcus silesiacus]
MALFDFLKKEEPQKGVNLDAEVAKIVAIYETYPEFPVMSPDRNVDEWVASIANGTGKIVPKESMIRNEDGLLPGEVLLLDWVNEKDSTTGVFPEFFEMELGIDPVASTNELLFADYLDILNDASVVDYWSLSQLNEVFEDNGLNKCRTKEEAIKLLKKEFTTDYIVNMVDPGIYVLMDKGQVIVDKYAEFIHDYLDTPPE